MKIYRFNTNIGNTESLQQLSIVFNKDRRIISFKADPQGMMEVSCNNDITEQEVKAMVSQAGFQAADTHVPGSSLGA